MSTPLWEMQTMWFTRTSAEYTDNTFHYKSWKDFVDCKPYKLWKPYILSSWCWKGISSSFHRPPGGGHIMNIHQILRTNPSESEAPSLDLAPGEEVEMFQIVFISPDRFSGMNRAEMVVKKEDEPAIRAWLLNHMPSFWKLE
jgi:hypothetical protein